jgi:hypothetical protein
MKVTLPDGREYALWFRYLRTPGTDGHQHRFDTFCLLQPYGQMQGKPTEGVALLHRKDRFEAEKGRKLALTRALEAEGFEKEVRRAVWQQYHNRANVPVGVQNVNA